MGLRVDELQVGVYTEIETMKATAPSAQIRASLQEPSIDEVIRACHRALKKHYGDRLIDVMVYGSAARGEMTPESDLDLLVLLRPPFDFFTELRQIVDVLYPIQLHSNRLISAKPASADDFERGASHFFRNIKAESMRVRS